MIFKPLMESYEKYVLEEAKKVCNIVHAELGNKAGVIGAASMALHYLKNDVFWI